MKYIAIFDIPDDHVIYKGRPAILFSHLEDGEVITMTVANEVFPADINNYDFKIPYKRRNI